MLLLPLCLNVPLSTTSLVHTISNGSPFHQWTGGGGGGGSRPAAPTSAGLHATVALSRVATSSPLLSVLGPSSRNPSTISSRRQSIDTFFHLPPPLTATGTLGCTDCNWTEESEQGPLCQEPATTDLSVRVRHTHIQTRACNSSTIATEDRNTMSNENLSALTEEQAKAIDDFICFTGKTF